MKIMASVAVLACVLAFPTAGEAQSRSSKAKSTAVAAQPSAASRYYGARTNRVAAAPCAARTWAGCQGWDPDPNVRAMIRLDAGHDDF
jgi:hypothetical protein